MAVNILRFGKEIIVYTGAKIIVMSIKQLMVYQAYSWSSDSVAKDDSAWVQWH